MAGTLNPSDDTIFNVRTTSNSYYVMSLADIKQKIGCNNFMLICFVSSYYYVLKYPDSPDANVYVGDSTYLSLGDNGLMASNQDLSQRNFFSYNTNTGNFQAQTGTEVNLSRKTVNNVIYAYYPWIEAGSPQPSAMIVQSYKKLFLNNTDITPVAYTWSSVSAITGKNKTVSLTTLKEESINGGSPVDDASASAFNNAPDSCSVGGIISAILPIIEGDPTSVALKYNIPSPIDSTYTSVKLVAKKKKIPKSKTDGDKIIDISPSSGSVTVNNLDELTKYYFVIFSEDNFGNKADSEPKDITTGEKPKKWKETISYLKMITG